MNFREFFACHFFLRKLKEITNHLPHLLKSLVDRIVKCGSGSVRKLICNVCSGDDRFVENPFLIFYLNIGATMTVYKCVALTHILAGKREKKISIPYSANELWFKAEWLWKNAKMVFLCPSICRWMCERLFELIWIQAMLILCFVSELLASVAFLFFTLAHDIATQRKPH